MSEIKVIKNGLTDYKACVKKVEDKFNELDQLESSLRKRLQNKEWQGKSRDKCEIMLTLTAAYKRKIKEILDEMDRKEQELQQNVSDFTWKSAAVKSL